MMLKWLAVPSLLFIVINFKLVYCDDEKIIENDTKAMVVSDNSTINSTSSSTNVTSTTIVVTTTKSTGMKFN